MKTQTFFLNGKALAIVASSLTLSGMLVFALGVFAGMSLPVSPIRADTGAVRTAAARPSQPLPGAGGWSASADEVSTGWPTSPPRPSASEPVAGEVSPIAPIDTAPKQGKRNSASILTAPVVSNVSYAVTDEVETPVLPDRDRTRYDVQVGRFREPRNVRELVNRLESTGMRPVVTVRDEGGRSLHVVTIRGYVGRLAALDAVRQLGDNENLVASAVPARESPQR